MPSPNLSSVRNVLALYAQRVQLQATLLAARAVTIATKTAELEAATVTIAEKDVTIAGLNADVLQKTSEAFALATQVSDLNQQYQTSEAARNYAETQASALGVEVQTKTDELAAAAAAAAALAAEEVAEDNAQALADAALQSEIDSLETQIADLLAQLNPQ